MLLIAITPKKNCFHPFGKRVLNIWKHGIVHAFSEFFRQENSKLSLCFRVGKLECSFHKNRTPSYNQLDLERRKRVAKSYSRLSQRKWGTNNSENELSWSPENELSCNMPQNLFYGANTRMNHPYSQAFKAPHSSNVTRLSSNSFPAALKTNRAGSPLPLMSK